MVWGLRPWFSPTAMRTRKLFNVLVIGGSLLAGCGGDDDGGTQASSETESPGTSETADETSESSTTDPATSDPATSDPSDP
ncbi:MAG: hypothetical protein KC636_23145, partial [Myxococcales bacterium]|nr:hypothetical protein [Myxococcales bacterium]